MLVGSPYGIVRVPRVGGFVQFIRVPADASEVKQIAKLSHGRFYVGPRTADLKPVLAQLKSRIGKTPKKEELSFAFGLGALGFLLAGAVALLDLAAEGSVKRLLVLCGAGRCRRRHRRGGAGAAARLRRADDLQSRRRPVGRRAGAGAARPGRDRSVAARLPRRLRRRPRRPRCEPLGAGQVPGPDGQPRQPRNHDAERHRLSRHLGRVPGRTSSFIPFIGCIPAEGGPRTPTGVGSIARPEQLGTGPIIRIVRSVEVRQPRVRAGLACKKGQRLVDWTASLGIYTALHPTPRQLAKVHLTTKLIKEHVWITASRSDLAAEDPGPGADPRPLHREVSDMRFEWPIALVALALIPLALAAYVLVERRRARYAIRFTNLDVLASVLPKSGTAQKRRFIPPLVFALAVGVALIGIARPAVARNVPREQATVVIVIDTSGSMVANDVEPNRDSSPRRRRCGSSSASFLAVFASGW